MMLSAFDENGIPAFNPWEKMERLYRPCIITEKIDGTNAVILNWTDDNGDKHIQAGSRTRWITPQDDNFGFARFVAENSEELMKLGEGYHYGEWYGQKIQRTYGLKERRFALFNVFDDDLYVPDCCELVPKLYEGHFFDGCPMEAIGYLKEVGSIAVEGYSKPEGIIVHMLSNNTRFKVTIEYDQEIGKQTWIEYTAMRKKQAMGYDRFATHNPKHVVGDA